MHLASSVSSSSMQVTAEEKTNVEEDQHNDTQQQSQRPIKAECTPAEGHDVTLPVPGRFPDLSSAPDMDEPSLSRALQRNGSGLQTETISASSWMSDKIVGQSSSCSALGGSRPCEKDYDGFPVNCVPLQAQVEGLCLEVERGDGNSHTAVPQHTESMTARLGSSFVDNSLSARTKHQTASDDGISFGVMTGSPPGRPAAVEQSFEATFIEDVVVHSGQQPPIPTSSEVLPADVPPGPSESSQEAVDSTSDGASYPDVNSRKIGDALRLVTVAEVRRFSKHQLLAKMTRGRSDFHWHDEGGSGRPSDRWGTQVSGRLTGECSWDHELRPVGRYPGGSGLRQQSFNSSGRPTYYSSMNWNPDYSFDSSRMRQSRWGWRHNGGNSGDWLASSLTGRWGNSRNNDAECYGFDDSNMRSYNSRRWRWRFEGSAAGPDVTAPVSSAIIAPRVWRNSDPRAPCSPPTVERYNYQQQSQPISIGHVGLRERNAVAGNRFVTRERHLKSSTFGNNCKLGGRRDTCMWPAWLNSNSGAGGEQSYLASPNFPSAARSGHSSSTSTHSSSNSSSYSNLKGHICSKRRPPKQVVSCSIWHRRRQRNNNLLTFPDTASLGGGALLGQSPLDRDDESDGAESCDAVSNQRLLNEANNVDEALQQDQSTSSSNSSNFVGDESSSFTSGDTEEEEARHDNIVKGSKPEEGCSRRALRQSKAEGNKSPLVEPHSVLKSKKEGLGGKHPVATSLALNRTRISSGDDALPQLETDRRPSLSTADCEASSTNDCAGTRQQMMLLGRPSQATIEVLPPSSHAQRRVVSEGESVSTVPNSLPQNNELTNKTAECPPQCHVRTSIPQEYSPGTSQPCKPLISRTRFERSHTPNELVVPPGSSSCSLTFNNTRNISIRCPDIYFSKNFRTKTDQVQLPMCHYPHAWSGVATNSRSRRGARFDSTRANDGVLNEDKRIELDSVRWRGARRGGRAGFKGAQNYDPSRRSHQRRVPLQRAGCVNSKEVLWSTRSKVLPVSQHVVDYRSRQLAIAKCSPYYQKYARCVDVSSRSAEQPHTPRADSSSTCGMFTMELLAWRHRVRQEAERLSATEATSDSKFNGCGVSSLCPNGSQAEERICY